MNNFDIERAAAKVRDAIGDSGRSKRSISDETGIPYPTLNRKLAGKAEFSFRELFLIASALGIAPWVLTPTEFERRVAEVAA